MAMPTSYDHLTPPYSAAHNKPLPPTPRQTQKTTAPTSLFAGGPHASSPRPGAGPREQDDLYYATFTPNAYNTSSPPAAQDVSRKLNLYCPRPQTQSKFQKILPRPNIPVTRRPRTESERLAAPNTMATQISSRQLPPLPSKPTSTWASSTFTFEKAGRKKRRPSEIFDINFGFSFPSRRRTSSEYSPNVSPRTSISSASGSPPQDVLDSFKRQRIDSTDEDVAMVFGIDQETLSTSTRCESGEAHPGALVDFSTQEPMMRETSASKLRVQTDPYHTYLFTTTTYRRNSFPPSPHRMRFGQTLDSPTQLFFSPLSPSFPSPLPPPLTRTSAGRKRASTLDRQDPMKRRSPERIEGSCEMKRSTSDPSTEAFLTHMRASLSARQKSKDRNEKSWERHPVFTDEAERGFLDDAPL